MRHPPLHFGHPASLQRFWRALASGLLEAKAETPFYLFSAAPIQSALQELDRHFARVPIRHWLSFKTQPLRPLLQWWRQQQRPIEVVSEFEFLAAVKEGFPPSQILVNGPAKHHWLAKYPVAGLCVNFDSVNEATVLGPLAKLMGWTVGLRMTTAQELDTEWREYPAQFGMTAPEFATALGRLRRGGVRPETLHFHLRTNVPSAEAYRQAIREAAGLCRNFGFAPKFLDCGGGFPPPHILDKQGRRLDAQFRLSAMRRVYEETLRLFPDVGEIWLENGRWLSARSGVLVAKVQDAKERRGVRHLICDGGRTLHALISTWEHHEILCCPPRRGQRIPTIVTGPTCMAFDRLGGRDFPRTIEPGDHLLWLEAGAYHLPWETRFCHGPAAVWWHDGRDTRRVRSHSTAQEWWGQWRAD